jgi:hypothetical protein
MELFSDSQCMQDEVDLPADGICRPTIPGLANVSSYRYVVDGGPIDAGCTQDISHGGGASINPQTVCCTP